MGYYSGTIYTPQNVQSACTQANGSYSTSACDTGGSFLGCCVSATQHTRSCYYGSAATKPALESGCNASNGVFCE